jgi:hypothetical protein
VRETRYNRSNRKSDPANGIIFFLLLAVAMWFLAPVVAQAALGVFVAGGLMLAVALLALKYALIVGFFVAGVWMLSALCLGGRRD